MNGKLLDTNIIIDLFRGENEVIKLLSEHSKYAVSVITLGELNYGAQLSKKPSTNIAQITRFSKILTVYDIDKETSSIFGKVKSQLRFNGTPIPENDIWIASVAIQHDLSLLSNDKHFKFIENLKLEEASH